MNVLFLYNSTQTFTNTVYEHLASFAEYSENRIFYAHADQISSLNIDLSRFDAVGIHFTIRLPFDQISGPVENSLRSFKGLKFLFIQDEYDFPKKAWAWINRLGIRLVFTVVPAPGIDTVYPRSEFKNTRFVTNLTGYVPEKLPPTESLPLPSQRDLLVGYRGRPLPIRYGQLGVEKISIGSLVKSYCDEHGYSSDIAWTEESRIYGPRWYDFVISCRSMLGSESGSNVFDWDGNLASLIEIYKEDRPSATDHEIYCDLVRPREVDGLMNQLSPRVFEAVAARTVLVLFEGEYSGVVKPWEHFIPLKKDGSNLEEVMTSLKNDALVDRIAKNAYEHVIASGLYSYRSFVALFDREIKSSLGEIDVPQAGGTALSLASVEPGSVTTHPVRSKPPAIAPPTISQVFVGSVDAPPLGKRIALYVWSKIPEPLRMFLRPLLKKPANRK
jgi:hypothetical protein